jgi:entericidin A
MKPFLMLTLVLMILGVTGCETMQGFGKDLQKVGSEIEKKADKTSE